MYYYHFVYYLCHIIDIITYDRYIIGIVYVMLDVYLLTLCTKLLNHIILTAGRPQCCGRRGPGRILWNGPLDDLAVKGCEDG